MAAVSFRLGPLLLATVVLFGLLSMSVPAQGFSAWTEERPTDSVPDYGQVKAGKGTTDDMEYLGAWKYSESGGASFTQAANGLYTTLKSKSPTHSLYVDFTSGSGGTDYGEAVNYRAEDNVTKLGFINFTYLVEVFSHNKERADSLDAGLRLRLYDATGRNFATYQYWLASWYRGKDVKSTSDPNTKVITTAKPQINKWLSFSRDPSVDWPIAWSKVHELRLELYTAASGTYGDAFRMFFDDLVVDFYRTTVLENHFVNSEVAMDIGVEVRKYEKDWYPGYDTYQLRIMGAANSRIGHKGYTITYENHWTNPPSGDFGIHGDNVGKWYNFGTYGWKFYLYGRAYDRVYICSNGWVAFQFPGGDYSTCPHLPQTLPTRDQIDANGNRIDGPDGVIAPLWRDLDLSAGGRIAVIQNTVLLEIYWIDAPNKGNGYTNSFRLGLNLRGDIIFGYGSVSSTDPTTSGTKIGIEDPAGRFGFEIPFASAVSSRGVFIDDPRCADNNDFTTYCTGLLTNIKFVVGKPAASDTSVLDFMEPWMAGQNIYTPGPPPRDWVPEVEAAIVETIVVDALCLVLFADPVPLDELGCFVLGASIAGGTAYISALAEDLSFLDYVPDDMSANELSGQLQVAVRDDRLLCGDKGYQNCDVDAALFDFVEWSVPKGSKRSTLEIQFGVQSGTNRFDAGPWYWTGVILAVGPAGTLFADDFERNSWTRGTDPADAGWLQWTTSGLWHLSGTRGYSLETTYSRHSARYGKEGTSTYNTGSRNLGSLTGPVWYVKSSGHIMCYWSWWDTETGTIYDKKLVQASLDRGKTWATVPGHQISDATDPRYTWKRHSLSLDTYVGKELMVRFFFDTVDGVANDYEGWYIDDVSVTKSATCPASAMPVYTAVMAAQGDGVAYARASTGASCTVVGASYPWSLWYNDGTTRKYTVSIDFANYEFIKGKVWVDLEAPGIADEAYFAMDVYYNGALLRSHSTSNGGNNWEGYMWSDRWTIGGGGTWKFVVTVWGLDWGSQTCWARGEFTVTDI